MEEHRQAERLQRQLQQEQAYLLSLQHDHRRPHPQQQPQQPQQDRSKPSYHAPEPKPHYDPADRAREVSSFTLLKCWSWKGSETFPRDWWELYHEFQKGPANHPFSMWLPHLASIRGIRSKTTHTHKECLAPSFFSVWTREVVVWSKTRMRIQWTFSLISYWSVGTFGHSLKLGCSQAFFLLWARQKGLVASRNTEQFWPVDGTLILHPPSQGGESGNKFSYS